MPAMRGQHNATWLLRTPIILETQTRLTCGNLPWSKITIGGMKTASNSPSDYISMLEATVYRFISLSSAMSHHSLDSSSTHR
jgi:hypothetical protein